ncbi:MAG: hypothetical protein LH606_15115, partial [Cytophagaceae bacterium]|nr:hypothetical protein [Cytophagaceae bacterium]
RGRMQTVPVTARQEMPVVPLFQPRRWLVWRVAASVAVLLGLGWLTYRLRIDPSARRSCWRRPINRLRFRCPTGHG